MKSFISFVKCSRRTLKLIIMPAYIIVEVKVNDPVEYDNYKKLTPGTLEPFGGKFIVRGGATQTLEGEWNPERMVVLEFPDAAAARGWWESPRYCEAKEIRYRTAESKMLLVEGC
jgi:uncharacterized protein (DUF1330 family)